MTLAGKPACTEGRYTCLIYQFIEGAPPWVKALGWDERKELLEIVVAVHEFPIPKPLDERLNREEFEIPFASALEELLQTAPESIVPEEKRVEFLSCFTICKRSGRGFWLCGCLWFSATGTSTGATSCKAPAGSC
jgi:hypothetical protein